LALKRKRERTKDFEMFKTHQDDGCDAPKFEGTEIWFPYNSRVSDGRMPNPISRLKLGDHLSLPIQTSSDLAEKKLGRRLLRWNKKETDKCENIRWAHHECG
jgi:hypothetical protein